jgi:hypothetical protein
MSFPNPDNYARDCDCGTAGANTTPPPATIQAEIDSIDTSVTALDTRVTALEETNDVIVSSGGIANLTTAQQALIREGSIVATTDGKRWIYSGAGSKILEASYIQLADTTPVSPLVFENGGTITMTDSAGSAGYINTSGDASGQSGGYIDTSATNNGSNGGYINTSGSDGAGGYIDTRGSSYGPNGGNINTKGDFGGIGGSINTSASDQLNASGGLIDTSGGASDSPGGTINTGGGRGGPGSGSSAGGSIVTRGGSGGPGNFGGGVDTSGGDIDGRLACNGGSIVTKGYSSAGGSIDTRGGNTYDTSPGGSITTKGVASSGGSIDTRSGSVAVNPGIDDYIGSAGGSINTSGRSCPGGSIDLRGGTIAPTSGPSYPSIGGSIVAYGGTNPGGSLTTYDGGGSINTRGTGSIELGVSATRTTLTGSATAARTITLPDTSGTVAIASEVMPILPKFQTPNILGVYSVGGAGSTTTPTINGRRFGLLYIPVSGQIDELLFKTSSTPPSANISVHIAIWNVASTGLPGTFVVGGIVNSGTAASTLITLSVANTTLNVGFYYMSFTPAASFAGASLEAINPGSAGIYSSIFGKTDLSAAALIPTYTTATAYNQTTHETFTYSAVPFINTGVRYV